MRAISLLQPYASLWLNGPKLHHTLRFRTAHRGWLLVHASRSDVLVQAKVGAICSIRFGADWKDALPRGAIIGAVYLADCEPTGMARKHVLYEDLLCGDFTPGRWAWRRTGPTIRLERPVPYRGMSGLFHVDHSVVPEVPAT